MKSQRGNIQLHTNEENIVKKKNSYNNDCNFCGSNNIINIITCIKMLSVFCVYNAGLCHCGATYMMNTDIHSIGGSKSDIESKYYSQLNDDFVKQQIDELKAMLELQDELAVTSGRPACVKIYIKRLFCEDLCVVFRGSFHTIVRYKIAYGKLLEYAEYLKKRYGDTKREKTKGWGHLGVDHISCTYRKIPYNGLKYAIKITYTDSGPSFLEIPIHTG